MEKDDFRSFELFGIEFPIYKDLLIKLTIATWLIMLLVLTVSIYFFGYEMTNADLPCGTLAGFLFAYLLTILIR